MRILLRALRLTAPFLTTFSGVLNPSVAYARTEAHFAREANLQELFLGELDSATRRIDVLVTDLQDRILKDKLVSLAQAGRQIRVLTTTQQDAGMLEAAKIDVRTVKEEVLSFFAIVDGPKGDKSNGEKAMLLTFSTKRLTARGDASLLRLTKEGDLALAYQGRFNALWAKAEDYGDKARHATDRTVKAAPAAALRFDGANAAHLAGAIDQAYKTVDVIARDLHRIEIYDALHRAAERGVQVRVLLEGREFAGAPAPGVCKDLKDGDANLDECLAHSEAVDLRYLYSPFVDGRQARIQTNYLVIDGKVAYTGSFAWDEAGETTTIGHLTTLRAAKTVKTFVTQFDRSFAAGREPFRKLASVGSLCGRLKTVSVSFQNMRSLQQYVSTCEQ